jgi:hypothetical protein
MTQRVFMAAHPLLTFLTLAALMSIPASASKVDPCISTPQASAVERTPARYGWCRCRIGPSYRTSSRYSTRRHVVPAYRPAYTPERTSVQRAYVERDDSNYVVQHRRSKKKSLAIIAGSAALGAAIGGIAGDGEGAAIGALTGGAAGFIYDRLTHKHRVHSNRTRETASRTSRTITRG